LSAVTPQAGPSGTYVFASWSLGGSASQTITATADATYTANFTRQVDILQVDISIKPGSASPVPINAGSHGKTPVAILSGPSFNAVTSVDVSSLTFGRSGNEKSLAFCDPGGQDVNGDGLPDLVCHFETQSTGFQSGDTLGLLKGKRVQGAPLAGHEAIRIVP
jgi:hypothetical protein